MKDVIISGSSYYNGVIPNCVNHARNLVASLDLPK